MIVQIVSILLLFMTEAETFCCLKSMVNISRQYLNNDKDEYNDPTDLREMRWYFTFDSQQFQQLCCTFFEEVKAKDTGFKQILKHFTKIQFKYIKLFEEWTKTLCLIHLPLSAHFLLYKYFLIYFR